MSNDGAELVYQDKPCQNLALEVILHVHLHCYIQYESVKYLILMKKQAENLALHK